MNLSALDMLCCPFCSGHFRVNGREPITKELEYGVLSCYCGHYPVVAGIPILNKGIIKRGTNGSLHETADQVIDLIETGRHREALLEMLLPPAPERAVLAPSWIRALPSFRGMARLKGLFGGGGLRRWREQGEALFTAPRDNRDSWRLVGILLPSPGCAWFELLHPILFPHGPTPSARGRFSRLHYRPTERADFGSCLRVWARYATFNIPSKRPACFWRGHGFLQPLDRQDLACARSAVRLCRRRRIRAFQGSELLCSVLLRRVLAFYPSGDLHPRTKAPDPRGRGHYSDGPSQWTREKALDGTIVPALPPEGYRALVVDMPHRLVDNRAIMARYLNKQGPPLAEQTELDELASTRWISLVASRRPELFYDYPEFEEWPHAQGGPLRLNPLYREERKDRSDNMVLRRVYPSAWYEEENASDFPQYLPETAFIGLKGMEALARQNRTPEIERLIEQGVVVAIPEPYLRLAPHPKPMVDISGVQTLQPV